MSFARFCRETEGMFAEWVDGEVIYQVVNQAHQDLVGLMYSALKHWVETHDAGKVCLAPYSMNMVLSRIVKKPLVRHAFREPDVFFVAKPNLNRAQSRWLEGPADIAIEVVSKDSRLRDRRDKFYEYAAAGVLEYWIIEPERKAADFYRLNAEGFYEPMSVESGVFRSEVLPGFWLRTEWLWQEPAPKLTEIAKDLGI
jgi:Uma2 family endonuclease